MPRKHIRKATFIYWLIDVRPETIADGWPNGKPFYCGKTVQSLSTRLNHHKSAGKYNLSRLVSKRIHECGEHVSIKLVEMVDAEQDWIEREKHWIAILRYSFPGGANISAGGQGVLGYIPSEETLLKLTAASRRKASCPEFRARLSKACTGRKYSAETRAKVGAAQRGKKISDAHRAIISATHKGKPKSEEQRAKMSAATKGKSKSEEHRAKIIERLIKSPPAKGKGKPKSEEHRAKLSEATENWYKRQKMETMNV